MKRILPAICMSVSLLSAYTTKVSAINYSNYSGYIPPPIVETTITNENGTEENFSEDAQDVEVPEEIIPDFENNYEIEPDDSSFDWEEPNLEEQQGEIEEYVPEIEPELDQSEEYVPFIPETAPLPEATPEPPVLEDIVEERPPQVLNPEVDVLPEDDVVAEILPEMQVETERESVTQTEAEDDSIGIFKLKIDTKQYADPSFDGHPLLVIFDNNKSGEELKSYEMVFIPEDFYSNSIELPEGTYYFRFGGFQEDNSGKFELALPTGFKIEGEKTTEATLYFKELDTGASIPIGTPSTSEALEEGIIVFSHETDSKTEKVTISFEDENGQSRSVVLSSLNSFSEELSVPVGTYTITSILSNENDHIIMRTLKFQVQRGTEQEFRTDLLTESELMELATVQSTTGSDISINVIFACLAVVGVTGFVVTCAIVWLYKNNKFPLSEGINKELQEPLPKVVPTEKQPPTQQDSTVRVEQTLSYDDLTDQKGELYLGYPTSLDDNGKVDIRKAARPKFPEIESFDT